MSRPVYFDTSVFLDIFAKTSPHKAAIFSLLQELQDRKITIYTSILTVEEASVLTYRRGQVAHDNHRAINRLARIWGIHRTIALTTAKHEAHLRDLFKEKNNQAEERKHRRRWDCFHIATAQARECTHLYTTDPALQQAAKATLSCRCDNRATEAYVPTPAVFPESRAHAREVKLLG